MKKKVQYKIESNKLKTHINFRLFSPINFHFFPNSKRKIHLKLHLFNIINDIIPNNFVYQNSLEIFHNFNIISIIIFSTIFEKKVQEVPLTFDFFSL